MIVPAHQRRIVTPGQVFGYLVVTSRQVVDQGWIVHIALPMLTHRLSPAFAQPKQGDIAVNTRTTGYKLRRAAALTLACGVISTSGAAPAQASLLGGLLGTVGGLVGGLVGVVSTALDTTTGLLTGADWGYSSTQTSMGLVNQTVGADTLHSRGYTGKGVGVALVDSGVVPVQGLTSGNIVNGPDLSLDNPSLQLANNDGFGHGTHMAGIIAGNDGTSTGFKGVAPGAKLLSVKVGAYDGAVDVSQLIAGIDWVVQHRNDNGMNIRVLSLSFGTDGQQSYLLDPLTYAVEVAWRKGIVVVVAAGNDGARAPLNDPAYVPFVIAVGASDHHGTVARGDDTVAEFSSRGDTARRPDLVAPGRSITSLRDPQSYIDQNYPSAVVRDRVFRGSGASQATAVASGAAALLLQARPNLTPDQVKQVLTRGLAPLTYSSVPADRGMGRLDVAKSAGILPLLATQYGRAATGLGSIDAARGTRIALYDDDVRLEGEIDVHGAPWAPP